MRLHSQRRRRDTSRYLIFKIAANYDLVSICCLLFWIWTLLFLSGAYRQLGRRNIKHISFLMASGKHWGDRVSNLMYPICVLGWILCWDLSIKLVSQSNAAGYGRRNTAGQVFPHNLNNAIMPLVKEFSFNIVLVKTKYLPAINILIIKSSSRNRKNFLVYKLLRKVVIVTFIHS